MAFTPKDWRSFPDRTTPLSAEALEDLESRVTTYADRVVTDAVIGEAALTAGDGMQIDLLGGNAEFSVDGTVARKADLLHAGDGLNITDTTIEVADDVLRDVDTTVVRTTGSQTITGDRAVTGTPPAILNVENTESTGGHAFLARSTGDAPGYGVAVTGESEGRAAFKASGSTTVALDAGSKKITNVDDPAADSDAATKKYVDDNAGGGGLPDPAGAPVGATIFLRVLDGVAFWDYLPGPSSWTTVSSFSTGWSGSLRWRYMPDDEIEFEIGASGLNWDSSGSNKACDIAATDGQGVGAVWHDAEMAFLAVKMIAGAVEFIRNGSNGSLDPWMRVRVPLSNT